MRTFVFTASIALALLTAGSARADTDTFLVEAEKLGMSDRNAALRNGYAVCTMRTEADADLTDRVIRGALDWLNRDQAAANTDEFAALAVKYLCPEVEDEPSR